LALLKEGKKMKKKVVLRVEIEQTRFGNRTEYKLIEPKELSEI